MRRQPDSAEVRPQRHQSLLSVERISKSFGGARVLADVTLNVDEGQRVSLIGSNGAGKTTLFNVITRIMPADGGTIVFAGEDLSSCPPHQLIRRGLARTFQHTALFPSLTVADNIRLPILANAKRPPRKGRSNITDGFGAIDEVIQLLDLGAHMATDVGSLPYAIQKRIEIARALVCRPKLMILDEPAGGINREEAIELEAVLRGAQEAFGVSLLIVEHNMKFVMQLSDYIYVLDHGVLIAEGNPTQVSGNPRVIQAYLGSLSEDA